MKKLTKEQLLNISKELLNEFADCGADEKMQGFFDSVLNMIVLFMMDYQEELDRE